MKKLRLSMAILIGSAIMFFGCSKNDTSNNPDNGAHSTGTAYVVNGESNSISVVNLSTNTVDKTFNLPQFPSGSGMGGMMGGGGMVNMWPHHISLSPDKSKLVVSFPGSDFNGGSNMMLSAFTMGSMMGNMPAKFKVQGKILVVDAVTGNVIKELTLDGIAYNAVFSPDGKEIWTAIMLPEGKVEIFDANTYNLLKTITVGHMPSEVSFSDDGTKVYVANGMSNSVSIIDALTKQVLDSPEVGKYPVGAWPGMGGMMDVDNEESQTVCFINNATNMVTDSVHLGYVPGMIANNTPMGQMWITDPNNSQIHVWTKSSSGYMMSGSITVGNGASAMAFNTDGTFCYVTNQNDGTVSVVDVAKQKEIMKIIVGKKPNGIVISNKL